MPRSLANAFGTDGGVVDLLAVVVMMLVAVLLAYGVSQAARVENILVVLKILAIIVFIIVGATAIKGSNYVPFIPAYHENADGTAFGGWQNLCRSFNDFLGLRGFDSNRRKCR